MTGWRPASVPVLACLAILIIGCGDAAPAASGPKPRLTVSAAASLKRAFEDYGRRFEAAATRFSFAGSDELAAQIRRGVRPDVFAAANTRLPQRLFEQGRVERPVVFAVNRLVVAVLVASELESLEDLERKGVKLAIGAQGVPIGSYTRELLGRLPRASERAVLANVRSAEPHVAGVLGKLTRGAAHAGIVYATDVVAGRGELRAIELPRRLQPSVHYAVAVVKRAPEPRTARLFVDRLVNSDGRRALRRAGFGLPPPR